MMKTHNAPRFETHKYTRNADELMAAQSYIYRRPIAVIGHSKFDAQLFKRLKMPALPLLVSNREQRMALIKPWFIKRCFASATVKCKALIKDIELAIQQEKQKHEHAFNLKDLLQDPLPDEFVDQMPMTYEEYQQWCSQM